MFFIPAVCNEVPYCSKEEPGDCICHDKDQQRAAPVQIHQSGEDICHVAVCLAHVTVLHITAAVLLHIALPLTLAAPWRETGKLERVKMDTKSNQTQSLSSLTQSLFKKTDKK